MVLYGSRKNFEFLRVGSIPMILKLREFKPLFTVVRIRRRPGTKGSQLQPLGLVHWQASWPLSTPSGQDVSLSEEESPPESPFVVGRGTPSRARNWALV